MPLSLLAIAVMFGVLFLWIERTSAQPMLNLALFKNRMFSFASLSALLSFMALYSLIFLTPFYLTFALHYSILKVGLVMAASPVVTTNSTIERKANGAKARFEQIDAAGYRSAYVIDGAGNLLQRVSATRTLCTYSHCTVAFSQSELDVLRKFLVDYFEASDC